MVVIEGQAGSGFAFQVKFRGVLGRQSRPMSSREDVELLGNTLLRHIERNPSQWLSLAQL